MNRFVLAGMLCLMLLISGCGIRMDTEETIKGTDPPSKSNAGDEMENIMDESMPEESAAIRMTIENTPVRITWEDNESVTALRELARKEPIQIHMSMYGGFEQNRLLCRTPKRAAGWCEAVGRARNRILCELRSKSPGAGS